MRKIGITSTIPIEVLFAAKVVPVDLNNVFIVHPDKAGLLYKAEEAGIPRNYCTWVKGVFSVLREEGVQELVLVSQGDCSSMVTAIEVCQKKGLKVIPFSYPHFSTNRDGLRKSIDTLIDFFGTTWQEVEAVKQGIDQVRKKVHEIDRLTWKENVVSGFENHFFSVSTSDMQGNINRFEDKIDKFLGSLSTKTSYKEVVRLGYIGVPPSIDNLYEFIESCEGRVVYNEVQHQFSMPENGVDIVEQYSLYTYPYGIRKRLEVIAREAAQRKLDGIIHYIQSFCHHQAEHSLITDTLPLPVIALECDSFGPIDARSRMRIESFIRMLQRKKEKAIAAGGLF